jgi:hypothetical protein
MSKTSLFLYESTYLISLVNQDERLVLISVYSSEGSVQYIFVFSPPEEKKNQFERYTQKQTTSNRTTTV